MSMKNLIRGVAAAATSVAVSAYAALPTGVDTAITGATTDGTTLVGSLAVAGAAVFLIAKMLRKFGILL